MKIGILTFHRPINYGAFLQAFALKMFLENNHHKVEFIDYWPKAHANLYKNFHCDDVNSFKSFVREIFLACIRSKRKVSFNRVQKHYLGLSKHIACGDNRLSIEPYDAVIYGSDQIWWKGRLKGFGGFDPMYWGDFIPDNIRKIAYAPSMGSVDISETDKVFIANHLSKFYALSVREHLVQKNIDLLTDKQVKVVLDPTFLLPEDCWDRYIVSTKEKNYVLYYNMMQSNDANVLAQVISQRTGCKIIFLRGAINSYHNLRKYKYDGINPFEFLGLIKNAKFVVSTSFHGVVFSIIFQKEFYALGMGDRTNRVESLLKQVDLERRLVSNIDAIDYSKIDYGHVKQLLEENRQESSSFLLNALME